MKKFIYWRGLVVAWAAFLFSNSAFALNCNEVRQLTGLYFKMHYAYHAFDDELNRRTLDNFVKTWDPGKVYFLADDVEHFEKSFGTQIGSQVMKSECGQIEQIVNVFAKRFNEAQKIVFKVLEEKHDFTVNEFLEIDRKNMAFAKTSEELQERWRKRVKFQLLQMKESLKDLAKSKDKIKKRYELLGKRQSEQTTDTVYSNFLNAFATALDPHSEYLPAERLEDFRISTRLSLEGIGAVLRTDDGFTVIQSLVPGGAAAKTGKMKVDDKIIAVAQGDKTPVDVIDMDLRDVVKLIRGARGTEVRLTVLRDKGDKNQQFVIPVFREEIQLNDRAAKSKVYDVNVTEGDAASAKATTLKIGVVTLPSFYMDFEGRQNQEENFRSSSRDMLKQITALKAQNIDGMIVDLRGNGGGSLDESINVAGLFIQKGPVVQIKRMEGSTDVHEDKDPKAYYEGPLAVLINRQSASASEIFAGAIQDYQRGLIVGDRHTFGKGTVQNLNDITEKLGAIKVTISKFYRPSGSSTQLRGVESNIVFPDIADELEIGEKHYDYALPWDRINQAEFHNYNMTQEYEAQLKTLSAARVTKDSMFGKIRDDIKKYKDNVAERNRVSLKEAAADKKSKDAKKKAEEDLLDEDRGEEVALSDDAHLQETLRVTADYIQLMRKKVPGFVAIPAAAKVAAANKMPEKALGSPSSKKKK